MEIGGEFEERIVLCLDIVAENLLLDYRATPVFIEPRLFDFFLSGMREKQGVVRAGNIQVDLVPRYMKIRMRTASRETNLEVDDMIV